MIQAYSIIVLHHCHGKLPALMLQLHDGRWKLPAHALQLQCCYGKLPMAALQSWQIHISRFAACSLLNFNFR